MPWFQSIRTDLDCHGTGNDPKVHKEESMLVAHKILCLVFLLQSFAEDVSRQMERERELQKRYADLQRRKEGLVAYE